MKRNNEATRENIDINKQQKIDIDLSSESSQAIE